MKNSLLIILCLSICGCAGIVRQKDEITQLEVEAAIAKKDAEITLLKKSIEERDAKIKELKNKLSSFGVFE